MADTHLHHHEEHLKSSDLLTDIVIGMSDGLTVPFALAAGLSGAVDSTSVIIIAGIAEIAAGSIAMGLGGYLAGKTEQDHYSSELKREYDEIENKTEFEKDIRDLTYTQGKILVKLIDRETGKTSYQIIKDFRGSIQAVFWQTLARIFDGNLKLEYDPFGDDKDIEEIVASDAFKDVVENPANNFKEFQKPQWYLTKWDIKQ